MAAGEIRDEQLDLISARQDQGQAIIKREDRDLKRIPGERELDVTEMVDRRDVGAGAFPATRDAYQM